MTPLPSKASMDTIVYLAHQNNAKPRIDPMIIELRIAKAAAAFNITVKDLKGKSRERTAVNIRHILCYILRYKDKQTTTAIGKAFNRDHTTVINSCIKYQEFTDVNDAFFISVYTRLRDLNVLN